MFQRSHRFRELLADDFPQFTTLTVGGRQKGLPPPHSVAIKLKEYTLALIKAWNAKYANKYRPIAIAYDHLQYNGILQDNQPSLDSIHSQNQDRVNRQVNEKKRDIKHCWLFRVVPKKKTMLTVVYST